MAGNRTDWEHKLVEQLHAAISPNVAITLLADRGFDDQKLYQLLTLLGQLLTLLGWDYVVRFRGAINVENDRWRSHPDARTAGIPRDLKV
jgi:hypothetical protein